MRLRDATITTTTIIIATAHSASVEIDVMGNISASQNTSKDDGFNAHFYQHGPRLRVAFVRHGR